MLTRGRSANHKVHLVLFATDGPPKDKGRNVRKSAERIAELASGHFDSVQVFTPTKLIEERPDWLETFSDTSDEIRGHSGFSSEMPWNEDWARIGYFLWKPRLLSEIAQKYGANDIILYHDPDCSRYPEYLEHVDKWRGFVLRSLRRSDVLLFRDKDTLLRYDTKPELLRKYGLSGKATSLKSIWAGVIAFRCNQASSDFLSDWYQECSNPDNLLPITEAKRSSRFYWHSADQAVLSALFHSRGRNNLAPQTRVIYLRESRQIPPRAIFLLYFEQLRSVPYQWGLGWRRVKRKFRRWFPGFRTGN